MSTKQSQAPQSGHSPTGASSMERWSKCAGSIKLSKGLVSVESSFAKRGTDAHELASKLLLGDVISGYDFEGEELESVMTYVDYVRAQPGKKLIEHGFDLSAVHPGLWGTCDAVVFSPNLLRVIDYKHGAGIPVTVENNLQLQYYGLGALLSTQFPCEEVELTIVQPRCNHPQGPVRSWRFPSFELLDFAADLKMFAVKTEMDNAPLVPGSHCRFCPAAGICPAVKSKALAVAKSEFGQITPETGKKYDPAELSSTLEWLPTLEGWIQSVRDFAYGEASLGREIPGWKLVEKRANRRWIDETATARFLKETFPQVEGFFTEPELKSPAQIEKVLHKKQHDKLVPHFISVSSGNVLVHESDKREAVRILDAKTEFETLDLLS